MNNVMTATVSDRPLAKTASGLRRFHRNQRGDVLPKVLLTIIAIAGIVALGTIVTSAMSKLSGNTSDLMTTTAGEVQESGD